VHRILYDIRTQVWVLFGALALATVANVAVQVLTERHFETLTLRREVIDLIEASARRAESEAVIAAFEGATNSNLEPRLREVNAGLSALLGGDPNRQIPPAPGAIVPAIEAARQAWGKEQARLRQASSSVPALRAAVDDDTTRPFMKALRTVDAEFEAGGLTIVHLLNVGALATDVFAVFIALAASLALLRQVSGPLSRLTHLSQEVEEGNIWARYGDTYPRGMVGTLAVSFDRMVESLGNKAQLERDALTDELTGLPNRRAFFIALEEIVREAEHSGGTFDVCFVDVDEFKSINDQFGHAEGDVALQDVAYILHQRFGDAGVIGRLGGDEFAVIYAGEEHLSTDEVSRDLALRLAELADTQDRPCAVEVSVGVSPYVRGDDADSLMQRADRSMYGEKRTRSEARSRLRRSA
jgi:diguanylate cyclase (GGDEF)-like protein